ncbi:hypothetical protein TH66_02340 [Carbonactinospora thermoautotrophica]|uniref:Uncharacterized protein n=1 Tax=Carbonactinospora thermoautotrophica TaxID=1469144 RepID=A0A132N6A6_9ACTN|nr:hypothetical protein LI90_2202 [Carbonactinospora thermoautotrophica]KWX05439.1 hypothetical protein TR74_23800 [Carbonactinospora thermoautotrophica]KWX05530.1 hypothetical protein TH66_02340 [Carbonactinospora thermoautotrophica]
MACCVVVGSKPGHRSVQTPCHEPRGRLTPGQLLDDPCAALAYLIALVFIALVSPGGGHGVQHL